MANWCFGVKEYFFPEFELTRNRIKLVRFHLSILSNRMNLVNPRKLVIPINPFKLPSLKTYAIGALHIGICYKNQILI